MLFWTRPAAALASRESTACRERRINRVASYWLLSLVLSGLPGLSRTLRQSGRERPAMQEIASTIFASTTLIAAFLCVGSLIGWRLY